MIVQFPRHVPLKALCAVLRTRGSILRASTKGGKRAGPLNPAEIVGGGRCVCSIPETNAHNTRNTRAGRLPERGVLRANEQAPQSHGCGNPSIVPASHTPPVGLPKSPAGGFSVRGHSFCAYTTMRSAPPRSP